MNNGLDRLKRVYTAVFIAFIVLSFVAYGNSITGDFVFDDVKIVKENPAIRSFSNIPRIFANFFTYKPLERQGMLVDPSYRPLRSISYIFDYQFTKDSPVGYHISNIIYHAIATFLLFILLLRLGANFFGAIAASIIFLLHPVNSEAVSYITGRKETLCAIFFFSSIITYLSYRENPSLRCFLLTLFFFLLALLAKEMALSLLPVLVLFELLKITSQKTSESTPKLFFKNLRDRRLIPLLTFIFILSLAYGLFSTLVKSLSWTGEDAVGYWGGSLTNSLLSFSRVVLFYIRLTIFPYPLSADYSYNAFPPSYGLLHPPATLFTLLTHLAVLSFTLFLILHKKFTLPFGILLFYITLVPVSGIVPLPERVAERFLYIPSISFAILIALGLRYLTRRGSIFAVCALTAIVLVFITLLVARNKDWQNNEALFSATLRHYSDCARANNAVGEAKLLRGDLDGALTYLERTLELLKRGDMPAEERNWLHGMRLNACFNRASILLKKKRTEEAVKELEALLKEKDIYGRVLAETPEFLHIRFNLAGAYLEMNRLEESEAEYRKVLSLSKSLETDRATEYVINANFHIGQIKMLSKNFDEAAEWFTRAAEVAFGKPKEVQMRYYEALALYESGKYRNAYSAFSAVTSLVSRFLSSDTPSNSLDIENMLKAKKQAELMAARSLFNAGDVENSLKLLATLCKEYPDWWLPYYETAQILSSLGRLASAEEACQSGLSLFPENSTLKETLIAIRLKKEVTQQKEEVSLPKRLKDVLETAKALIRNNEREKAEELLKKVLFLGSSVPSGAEESFYFLADAQITLLEEKMKEATPENLAEAKRLVQLSEKASIESTRKAILWRRLAALFEKIESSDDVLFAWLKVVENNPDYLGAHFSVASLLLRKGDTAAALKHFNASIEQGYKADESYYHIGRIYFEKNLYEKAAEALRNALAYSRDEKLHKEIKKLLKRIEEVLDRKRNSEERK
ncbi:MAG: tetratricopeptide repeat protein [Planctomycetota bacterium]|nr:tetratricopeptide repeat protein [Planctomycetota bacterium]